MSAIPACKRGRLAARNKPSGRAKAAVSRSHAAASARRKRRNGRLPRHASATPQLFRQGAAGLFKANKLYISAAARPIAAEGAHGPARTAATAAPRQAKINKT